MGGSRSASRWTDDPLEPFARAHAVLDFTAPAATVELAALAAQARVVHVIGTTGLEDDICESSRPRRATP
jgi:4-hydroxy-tetrahydrodipicolinate reductase